MTLKRDSKVVLDLPNLNRNADTEVEFLQLLLCCQGDGAVLRRATSSAFLAEAMNCHVEKRKCVNAKRHRLFGPESAYHRLQEVECLYL